MLPKQKDPIIVQLGDGITMTFRHIPAGRFRMGHRSGDVDEEPAIEVEVPEFWMGESPVTQEQYRIMAEACIEELSAIEGNLGSEPSKFKDRADSPQRPVEQVNWQEARVVARWLMKKMRDDEALPLGHVVDLPPETLWEFACRAGTDTEYWSGDGQAALVEAGWYGGNAGGQTHRVGVKNMPNFSGLHDMHGNVNEWCLDLYEAVRGRFRIAAEGGAAYTNQKRLLRPLANPDYVTWAALFTRIVGSRVRLTENDNLDLLKLLDFANRIVDNGDPTWDPLRKASEGALLAGEWPEEHSDLAEELRVIFQVQVDASSDAAEPDRVLRGGSWGSTGLGCRSTCRLWRWPGDRNGYDGFRLSVFLGQAKQGLDDYKQTELGDGALA